MDSQNRFSNELPAKSKYRNIMLAISLMRMGAKKSPFYRVVVKEKRSKRDGKYLENLGTYNPMTNPAEVSLKHDRIQYWIGVGAKPSETVASLIKNNQPVAAE
jgi:small subunit ribosomal protein S16